MSSTLSTPPQNGSDDVQLSDEGESSQIINTEEFQKELELLEKENQAIMKLMSEAYQKFDHMSSPESVITTDNDDDETFQFSSLSGVTSLIPETPRFPEIKTPISKSSVSDRSPFPGLKSVAASPFISKSYLKENGMKLSPTGTPPNDSSQKISISDLRTPSKSNYSNDEVSPSESSFMSPISEPETSTSSVPKTPVSKSPKSSFMETPMKNVVRDLKDSPTPTRSRPTPLSEDRKHFVSVSQIDTSFQQSEYIRRLEKQNAVLTKEIAEKRNQIVKMSSDLQKTIYETQKEQQKLINQQSERIVGLSQKLSNFKSEETVARECYGDFVKTVMGYMGSNVPKMPSQPREIIQYTQYIKQEFNNKCQTLQEQQYQKNSISDETKAFLTTIMTRIDSVEDKMRQIHDSIKSKSSN